MYPLPRLLKELFNNRGAEPLGLTDVHVSTHICWPWDLDLWAELNNGRTLTLYDLGRVPLAQRTGLLKVLRENRWGLTVAGATVRYRKRVRAFDRIEMRSRAIGRDARFVYIEQGMWVRGTPTSHVLYRTAITDANGIVATDRLANALGTDIPAGDLPDWVQSWVDVENQRPWPPMMDEPPVHRFVTSVG